ncbi:glycerol-3-phosphate 1-O-acyltransferase PlsY [Zavarzinia sp. CC-PAN008]|uniref:glycerol-3-phosphate 1-O-acyltransferase PlsY n=1 Tax=Zavarzinia sp. CC-PAN008 TaxID=3243332 RepID=UPI003F744DC9
MILDLVLALVGGYFLGSVPFGLVLTRAAGLGDIRKIGSGNIGFSNALRTGNKPLAFAVLILDSGKGAIAVGLFWALLSRDAAAVAGGAACFGHCFPVWLGFKGGKAVATFLGTMLAIAFPVGLACCAAWAVMAAIFRISSVASLTAALAGPIAAYFLDGPAIVALAAFGAALIWSMHHGNIRRLLSGTEPKFGARHKAPPA